MAEFALKMLGCLCPCYTNKQKAKLAIKVFKHVPRCANLEFFKVMFWLQIFLPGWGCIICSFKYKKKRYFTVGILQFLTAFIIIGWPWSWAWAYLMKQKRKVVKMVVEYGKLQIKQTFGKNKKKGGGKK